MGKLESRNGNMGKSANLFRKQYLQLLTMCIIIMYVLLRSY